jgi:glycerol-3-phosphate dehydrogenase
VDGVDRLITDLITAYPFLTKPWAKRLIRAYGTDAQAVLGKAEKASDLGRDFGATLSEAEVQYLREREFATTAQDILWRRTKLGLRFDAVQTAALETYLTETA